MRLITLFSIISIIIGYSNAFAIPLQPGNFLIKFTDYEVLNLPSPNQIPNNPNDQSYYQNNGDGSPDNWGIFTVTSISVDGLKNPYWFPIASDGTELTGEFYGIDVQSWYYDSSSNKTNVQSVGGQLDLFWDNTPDWDGTRDHAVDGQLVASFQFVPGVDPTNDATIDGDFDGSTLPNTGDANAFLSVIPNSGPWWTIFDSNYFPVTWTDDSNIVHHDFADVHIQNDFLPNPDSNKNIYPLRSQDPVTGYAVPEPATLFLFGSGLLGLGGISSRRKKK